MTILREAWWESDNSAFFFWNEIRKYIQYFMISDALLSGISTEPSASFQMWLRKENLMQSARLTPGGTARGRQGAWSTADPATQLGVESSEEVADPRIWKYAYLVKACFQYASVSLFPSIKKNIDFYFIFPMPVFKSRSKHRSCWLCQLMIHFFHAQEYLDQNLSWSISCYK